jgi:hypothetical protein
MSYDGARGALVIVAVEAMLAGDVEISPTGDDSQRRRGTVARRVRRNQPAQFTAEFPSLAPGDYNVWREVGGVVPSMTVSVAADKVTEASLAGSATES